MTYARPPRPPWPNARRTVVSGCRGRVQPVRPATPSRLLRGEFSFYVEHTLPSPSPPPPRPPRVNRPFPQPQPSTSQPEPPPQPQPPPPQAADESHQVTISVRRPTSVDVDVQFVGEEFGRRWFLVSPGSGHVGSATCRLCEALLGHRAHTTAGGAETAGDAPPPTRLTARGRFTFTTHPHRRRQQSRSNPGSDLGSASTCTDSSRCHVHPQAEPGTSSNVSYQSQTVGQGQRDGDAVENVDGQTRGEEYGTPPEDTKADSGFDDGYVGDTRGRERSCDQSPVRDEAVPRECQTDVEMTGLQADVDHSLRRFQDVGTQFRAESEDGCEAGTILPGHGDFQIPGQTQDVRQCLAVGKTEDRRDSLASVGEPSHDLLPDSSTHSGSRQEPDVQGFGLKSEVMNPAVREGDDRKDTADSSNLLLQGSSRGSGQRREPDVQSLGLFPDVVDPNAEFEADKPHHGSLDKAQDQQETHGDTEHPEHGPDGGEQLRGYDAPLQVQSDDPGRDEVEEGGVSGGEGSQRLNARDPRMVASQIHGEGQQPDDDRPDSSNRPKVDNRHKIKRTVYDITYAPCEDYEKLMQDDDVIVLCKIVPLLMSGANVNSSPPVEAVEGSGVAADSNNTQLPEDTDRKHMTDHKPSNDKSEYDCADDEVEISRVGDEVNDTPVVVVAQGERGDEEPADTCGNLQSQDECPPDQGKSDEGREELELPTGDAVASVDSDERSKDSLMANKDSSEQDPDDKDEMSDVENSCPSAVGGEDKELPTCVYRKLHFPSKDLNMETEDVIAVEDETRGSKCREEVVQDSVVTPKRVEYDPGPSVEAEDDDVQILHADSSQRGHDLPVTYCLPVFDLEGGRQSRSSSSCSARTVDTNLSAYKDLTVEIEDDDEASTRGRGDEDYRLPPGMTQRQMERAYACRPRLLPPVKRKSPRNQNKDVPAPNKSFGAQNEVESVNEEDDDARNRRATGRNLRRRSQQQETNKKARKK